MRRCSGSTPWVTSAAWFKSLPAIIIHLLRSMARPLIVSLSIRPFSNSFMNLPTRSTPSQLYHPPVPEEVRSRGITVQPYPLSDTKLSPSRRKIKFVRPVFLEHHFEWCGFSSRSHRKSPHALQTSQMPLLPIERNCRPERRLYY